MDIFFNRSVPSEDIPPNHRDIEYIHDTETGWTGRFNSDAFWFKTHMYEAELRGYIKGQTKLWAPMVERMRSEGFSDTKIAELLIDSDILEEAIRALTGLTFAEIDAIEEKIGKKPKPYGEVLAESIQSQLTQYAPLVNEARARGAADREIAKELLHLKVDNRAISKLTGLSLTDVDYLEEGRSSD